MRFADVVSVGASPEEVWAVLQDPATIGQCISGVEELRVLEDGRVIAGTANLTPGASALRLPVRVEWLDRSAPSHGTLRAVITVSRYEIEGMGTIELAAHEDGETRIAWEATVEMPGPLDRNPLVANVARSFARRFIKEFFTCLHARFKAV